MAPRHTITLAALALLLFAGCGSQTSAPEPEQRFSYDAGAPLETQSERVDPALVGGETVRRITFAGKDRDTVPTWFAPAEPGDRKACVIYLAGLGSKPENALPVARGLRTMGVSTLAVEIRGQASRGDALAGGDVSAKEIAAIVDGTVIDVRRAVDMLGKRPECQGRIGILGISLGGWIATLAAASDDRIAATILLTTGDRWATLERGLETFAPGTRVEGDAGRLLVPIEPERWIAKLGERPVLLGFGRNDPIVRPEDAKRLEDAAVDPDVVTGPGAHDVFTGGNYEAFAPRIEAFLERSLLGR